MPLYTNASSRFIGKKYLQIPPDTADFRSIYYYTDTNLTMVDGQPYYNPILFKELIKFNGNSQYIIEFPQHILESSHLYIHTQCSSTSYDSIEVVFNDPTNLPSMPLTNSDFSVANHNRIKKLIVTTKSDCMGEILIMLVDKFIPANMVLTEDPAP